MENIDINSEIFGHLYKVGIVVDNPKVLGVYRDPTVSYLTDCTCCNPCNHCDHADIERDEDEEGEIPCDKCNPCTRNTCCKLCGVGLDRCDVVVNTIVGPMHIDCAHEYLQGDKNE